MSAIPFGASDGGNGMRNTARVVVVGGGCVGVNILYALARRGWSDSLLLEGNVLGGASTRHAAGFIPTYVRQRTLSRLLNRTVRIYAAVEAETGASIGVRRNGQMRIARTPERMDEYRRYMDAADALGARAELLSPSEALDVWPLMRGADGMLGALYHPDDAMVGATDVTMALAKGARDRGALIVQNTRALSFTRTTGGEWRVETTAGSITCEHLVLASGNHARQTGAMLGLDIPALPVVVQYWITEPVPEITARKRGNRPELPIVRDEAYLGYLREEGEGLLFGTYERPEHLQLFDAESSADLYDGRPLPPDLDAHAWALEKAADLIPAFGRAGLRSNVRGPMQMTPDGNPLVGPAWGLRNVWLAEGVPGGVLWGGAIGDTLSEWMVEGEPSDDLAAIDARRFGDYATRAWTRAKVLETWGTHSDTHVAAEERPAARPAKTAPCHDLLSAAGAVWVMRDGWEVAARFGPTSGPASKWETTAAEVEAVMTAVGLADTTPIAKFEISGPKAAHFLARHLCIGLPDLLEIAPSYRLNRRGGVTAAFEVARLAPDRFLLLASVASQRRDFDDLWRDLPDRDVALVDVTGHWGAFTLAGPHAGAVLGSVAASDVSASTLPGGRCVVGDVGLASGVRVLRTDAMGGPTYEIHHPMAYQRHLLQALLAAGELHGLQLVGADALDAVRLCRSILKAGVDLGPEIPALPPGMHTSPRPDIAQGGASPDNGCALTFVTLEIDGDGPEAIGLEGLYDEGALVGWLTSAGRGVSPDRAIALALLRGELASPGRIMSLQILQRWRTARVLPASTTCARPDGDTRAGHSGSE